MLSVQHTSTLYLPLRMCHDVLYLTAVSPFRSHQVIFDVEEASVSETYSHKMAMIEVAAKSLTSVQLDDVIGQAQAVSSSLGEQRGLFDNIGTKLAGVSGKFPVVNGVLNSIRRKKNKVTFDMFTFRVLAWDGGKYAPLSPPPHLPLPRLSTGARKFKVIII